MIGGIGLRTRNAIIDVGYNGVTCVVHNVGNNRQHWIGNYDIIIKGAMHTAVWETLVLGYRIANNGEGKTCI